MNIPKRQDVVTRIDREEQAAVSAACGRVAVLLSGAKELPLLVDMDILGETAMLRSKVVAKIEEAGWRIERERDELGNFASTRYSIS